MFNSWQPPLLVQPVPLRFAGLFPPHEGYCVHALDETQALLSFGDGWTFPLTGQKQQFISDPPLLLIKESGGITSASGTMTKGYAHHFCRHDGTETTVHSTPTIFPDKPNVQWMLVHNAITMIWLQYGNKDQFCGECGQDIERIFFGRILIRQFDIEKITAPRLGKDAADEVIGTNQYYVHDRQLYKENWSLSDRDVEDYLKKVLVSHHLEQYQSAVTVALNRAGYVG